VTRYVDDGPLEIDNSAAERSLRAVLIGRKNDLFMGSDSGGQPRRGAYNLIATAKLNGLDPMFDLRTILAQIWEHPTVESRTAVLEYHRLIPDRLLKTRLATLNRCLLTLAHFRLPVRLCGSTEGVNFGFQLPTS
jgi:hypothetical protein